MILTVQPNELHGGGDRENEKVQNCQRYQGISKDVTSVQGAAQ